MTAVRGMDGPIHYDDDGVTQIKGDSYAGFNQKLETQEFLINGDFETLNFVGGLFYFNEFYHNDRLSQSASGPVDNVGVQTHATASSRRRATPRSPTQTGKRETPIATSTATLAKHSSSSGYSQHLRCSNMSPAGWYTELLAPALAKRGKLFVTSDDPNGSAGERSVAGYHLKLLLETSSELFAKVEPIPVDAKSPKIPLEGKLDLVLVIRELHNLLNDNSVDQWLAEFRHALKPKGVLGIVDHRALAGADPEKSAKLGYLPEAWAIEKIEAAGFKLTEKSEINANPRDTKDYPDGVWTLPPSCRLGGKDREKYAAIGESDRFTPRFVKSDSPSPAAPAAKASTRSKP